MKTSVSESLFNKVYGNFKFTCNFIKKIPTQVFSCEICEVFKNIFFYKTPPVAASVTKFWHSGHPYAWNLKHMHMRNVRLPH